MRDLLHYFNGYRKETVLGPFFKLLEALVELLVPLVIASIIDQTIPSGQTHRLYGQIAVLIGLALLGGFVALIAQYFSSKSAIGFTKQLNQDLFEKIMTLPKSSRDQLGSASLVARLTADTLQIQTGINIFLRLFLRAPIIVCGAIIMAFQLDATLATYFLVMVSLLVLIVSLVSKRLTPLYTKGRLTLDKMIQLTREQFQGMRVIRAFGQISRETSAFTATNQAYTGLQLQAGQLANLIAPLTFLTVNVTLLVILWQGGLKVGFGGLQQGALIALVNYLLQILTELLKLAILVNQLNQTLVSAKRVSAIFAEPSEPLNQKLPQQVSKQLAISAKDLSLTYPLSHEPALNQLSFEVKCGESLGIIGGTGSGKSTLVQLLSHFYQPTTGELLLFHHGKSPATIQSWRELVRLVPQKAELFKGTVRDNLLLGLGRDALSDDQLWLALDRAQAADFVREKGGLDASVEAFGANFSGGQRQRLTIARALVVQRPFLVLDDATSALDYLTEHQILTTLKELDTTLVIVSQRTRSLKDLDHILVLDEGRLAGFGRHDSLLEICHLYRDIHNSQQLPQGGHHV